MDFDIKVSQVIFVRYGADSRDTAWQNRLAIIPDVLREKESAYGSAINLSVSLMMRLGRAMFVPDYTLCTGQIPNQNCL